MGGSGVALNKAIIDGRNVDRGRPRDNGESERAADAIAIRAIDLIAWPNMECLLPVVA